MISPKSDRENAFTALWAALTSNQILRHLDPDAPKELQEDASGALAATPVHSLPSRDHLCQQNSYTRRTDYTTTEKGFLAMVWAIRKLRF